MALRGLRRKIAVSLASLLSLTGGSCAPSSEIGRTLENLFGFIANPDNPWYVPTYPPYVMEDTAAGNHKYPVNVVDYDDVTNAEHLVNGKCSDSGYTTIKKAYGPNAVENGFIVKFDHDIKGRSGKDISIKLYTPDREVYYGVYLVVPKEIYFKEREKAISFNGWNNYAFYLIHEHNGSISGSVFDLDVEHAVQNAGRSSPYVAVMNFEPSELRVWCLIDLHGD